jgi:transposase
MSEPAFTWGHNGPAFGPQRAPRGRKAKRWDSMQWGDDSLEKREIRGWPHHAQCTPAPSQQGNGWTKGPPPVSVRRSCECFDLAPIRREPQAKHAPSRNRYTDAERAAIVRDYLAGMSQANVAKKHGISNSTVNNALHAAGIDIRGPKTFKHDVAEWVRLYMAGHSGSEIARMYGASVSCVCKAIAEET